MGGKNNPAYDLSEIQRKVGAGAFRITFSARAGAALLGLGEADIVRCVLELRQSDFYKSMEAETAPGLWQDVYRPVFEGLLLYVKVQIAIQGDAVVISFKER